MNEAHENGFLIVGLGNPGREYKGNRHNVGFMVLDTLASHFDVSFTRIESKALMTKTNYKGKKILLSKPQTYMNLSGQSVGQLTNFYKIPFENIIVAYDEVDLPFGSLRLRPEGGSAGHKGLQSIIDQLGTNQFPRLRIGVGRPPGRKGAANYVLRDFSVQEKEILDGILKHASEAVLEFIENDLETAMNKFNGEI
jgi:peptidyl-tRNA hydrolase, PTH1 family